jgi:hypothetical protein
MFNNNTNGYSLSDIAAATGNNNNGFGFNGDGAWIFFLFILMLAGGWNNNGFGGNGQPAVIADVQRGFDQSALMNSLNGVTAAVNTGFSNAEVSRCNSQANILQTLNNNQANLSTQLNTIAMNQQNCCCENRAGLADLKYNKKNYKYSNRLENANNHAKDELIGIYSTKEYQEELEEDLLFYLKNPVMYIFLPDIIFSEEYWGNQPLFPHQ